MRNAFRVVAFDVLAPLAVLASLVYIGLALERPLWWVVVGTIVGLLVLQALVAHKVFRKAQGQIRKRAPTPKWIETELKVEVEKARRRPAGPVEAKVKAVASTAKPLAIQTGALAAGNKAGDLAKDGYTAVLVGGGIVLTVSVLALVGVTLASGGRK